MLTQVRDRAGLAERFGQIRTSIPAVLALCMLLAACGKAPDQRAYDDVVATMSLKKAEQFFERYPRSSYRDRLVDDLVGWCRREGTEACFGMVLDVIPKDHPGREEAVADYRRRFGGRAR